MFTEHILVQLPTSADNGTLPAAATGVTSGGRVGPLPPGANIPHHNVF